MRLLFVLQSDDYRQAGSRYCWTMIHLSREHLIPGIEGTALKRYGKKGTREHDAISRIVSGPEAMLREGFTQRAADKTTRREICVKWWSDLNGANGRSLRSGLVQS